MQPDSHRLTSLSLDNMAPRWDVYAPASTAHKHWAYDENDVEDGIEDRNGDEDEDKDEDEDEDEEEDEDEDEDEDEEEDEDKHKEETSTNQEHTNEPPRHDQITHPATGREIGQASINISHPNQSLPPSWTQHPHAEQVLPTLLNHTRNSRRPNYDPRQGTTSVALGQPMSPSIIYAPTDSRQFNVHVQGSPVAHEELQHYRQREERSRADFAIWKTGRAQYDDQLSTLRREGAERDRAMDRSTASVEKANAERDACSKESRKLQVEAIKNQKAIAVLEADLKSAKEGWSYYHEKWVELHSESYIKNSECNELIGQATVTTLETEAETLRADKARSHARVKEGKKKIADLEVKVKEWATSHNGWMKKLNTEAEERNGQIELLQAERDALHASIKEKDKLKTKLERKSERLIGEARKWKKARIQVGRDLTRDGDDANTPEDVLSQSHLP
tara:strand:+ start:11800 stop:13143 length:1344 start_codon:yes stop_codon:yes gene_type:complete